MLIKTREDIGRGGGDSNRPIRVVFQVDKKVYIDSIIQDIRQEKKREIKARLSYPSMSLSYCLFFSVNPFTAIFNTS